MITDTQLQQIMTKLPAARLQLYLPPLNTAMQTYEIETMLRTAAFVAQLAHESGEFRWMEEIWGPTPAQQRYEPPSDLATRLGNTQHGDGARFKGRGPIQITGRANYQKYGSLLGIDLVAHPELASTPDVAFQIAGLFWKSNGLNELADAEQFVTTTKRINGGTNGLADRQMYYERAKTVLAADFVGAPVSRGAVTPDATQPAAPLEPLSRGQEALFDARASKANTVVSATAATKKAVVTKPAARKSAARKTSAARRKA